MAVSETPPFWFEEPGLKAWLMAPLSLAYSRAAALAMRAKPAGSVPVPVLCIGNFVTGGGGKTPTALALAKTAVAMGLAPGFLSRGYGGRISGPERVDTKKHNSGDVGDEPLLLARTRPTVISADRVAGAKLLAEIGCDLVIMDDGFQNPRLTKDYALVVVDSKRGIGNGFAMPAGPLRVRIADQLPFADAVLIIGDEPAGEKVVRLAARSGKPVHHARTRMINAQRWRGKSLLAYSGIADPQKFFDSLVSAGGQLAMVRSFPDHHPFTRSEITELLDRARLMKAELVTTAKDYVRLIGSGEAHERLARESLVASIELAFSDDGTDERIIRETLARFEQRRLREEKAASAERAESRKADRAKQKAREKIA
ncbi:MAG: tetraacyldisaccharide 4'-kinase [Nitratireductor sp.]|nr:tetraacyldisaccharide 4'-kinase [Nitratireductor sp.]